jgi:hypothetical protein
MLWCAWSSTRFGVRWWQVAAGVTSVRSRRFESSACVGDERNRGSPLSALRPPFHLETFYRTPVVQIFCQVFILVDESAPGDPVLIFLFQPAREPSALLLGEPNIDLISR